MRRRLSRVLIAATAVVGSCLAGQSLIAQVAPDRPRLIVNPSGPAGLVWKLAFTPDSRSLLIAGSDKMSHLFHLAREQGQSRATFVRSLHWEISRGFRGAIITMDISPKGDLIAIGGYSARNTGDVILFSTATGEIARALPPLRNAQNLPGHQETVVSLAFSPDGTHLVSVDKTGEAILWSGPEWSPTTLRSGIEDVAETQMPVLFLDNVTVALGSPPSAATRAANVELYNIQAPNQRPAVLNVPHAGFVATLARESVGARWASADKSGAIFLWDGANAPRATRFRAGGGGQRVPTSLAFGPGNLLGVGNELDGGGQTVIELWNLATGQMVDQMATGTIRHNPTVAFSPDGKWFAVQTPEDHEVLLYPVPEPGDGKPLKWLSQLRSIRVLRGRGQVFRHVVFEAGNSHRMGLSPSRNGSPTSAYDLRGLRFFPDAPEEAQWQNLPENPGGWGILAQPGSVRLTLQNEGRRFPLELDRILQGTYQSHAWITDAAGRVLGIAIGTDEQNGIFVYLLPNRVGEAPRLVRYYRDHAGMVTSLAVSTDGKLLASTSEDQTVKVWSLEGLTLDAFAAGWGARFARVQNQVQVAETLPAGIAEGRGLVPGDVVFEVRQAGTGTVVEPAAILAALERQSLMDEIVLRTRRNGQERPLIRMMPAWEPMATLFVDRRNEWAIWSPRGYYVSSAAEGDELFGWQINRGAGTPPRIVKAANLRREFERRDLMEKLFAVGSLKDAFVAVNQQPPELETVAADALSRLPELTVVSPSLLSHTALGAAVNFTVDVTLPPGQNSNDYIVRGTVDGIPLGEPQQQLNEETRRMTLTWNAPPPDRLSQFCLKFERRAQTDKSLLDFAEARATVTADVPPRKKYQMHILAFAAGKYAGGAFGKLDFPVRDVESVIDALARKSGTHYELPPGNITQDFDQQVTPKTVGDRLTAIESKLRNADPQDLLVVLIAGHGDAAGGDYYFIPPNVQNNDAATLARDAVSWTELSRLTALPCRKLFLLDTCRSGNILDPDDQKASIRSLKQAECMVVAATSAGGVAFEGPQYNNHGAFTYSLLRAFGSLENATADGIALSESSRTNDPDGDISLLELVQYIKQDVPQRTIRKQWPTYTPSDLAERIGETRLLRPQALNANAR